MPLYKFNPDGPKIHSVANRTPQCNFPLMDNDETNIRAENVTEALRRARRIDPNTTKCLHCLS